MPMSDLRRWWRALLAVAWLAAGPVVAREPWVEPGPDGGPRVHLYFFWAETCPHCLQAHPVVEAVSRERSWVSLHALEVSRDRDNAKRFVALAESLGERAEAVPTLIWCGRMEVGWSDDAISGARLAAGLDDCRTQYRQEAQAAGAQRRAKPAAETPANPAGEAEVQPPAGVTGRAAGNFGVPAGAAAAPPLDLPLLGRVDARELSLPVLTVVLAGLDAFNPCAFFVLLFLLSLLSHQRSRRRMLAVGGIFIAASGLMYFAFMAAWLSVFQLLGAMAWITAAAGGLAVFVGAVNVKDYFAFERGLTLSIPESAKPGIYRRARAILQSDKAAGLFAATVLLAVAANFYELLCTAGFPMVYTRILTLEVAEPALRHAWLALYNAIYVVPLLLIVLAFVGTLSAHRLTERGGRLLKLMSGTMMLELGLLLLFAPAWLNSVVATFGLLALALAVTAFAAWRTASGSGHSTGGGRDSR